MKKHLVIVAGGVYPEPSPTGKCALRYASVLKDDFDIDFVFLAQNADKVSGSEVDGMRFYSLCGKRLMGEYKSSGILKKLFHILGAVEIKLFTLGNLSWFKKAAVKKLEEINREKKIDAVFTICSPFAAHMAGCEFKKKHPEVKHVEYTVDLFSTEGRIKPLFKNLADFREKEKAVFQAADSLLLSEEIYNTHPELYSDCKNCSPLPYLLPEFTEFSNNEKIYFTDNKKHFVYAGRFYEKLREPTALLKLFSSLENKNAVLDLFSVGCDGEVGKFANENDNIVHHAIVSSDEIIKVYGEADVLVGVGNTAAEFLPSKTYEYIVTGKPILYVNPAGTHNEILDRYPLCFQIESGIDEDKYKKSVETFFDSSKNVKREDILKAYSENTAENVRKILINAL